MGVHYPSFCFGTFANLTERVRASDYWNRYQSEREAREREPAGSALRPAQSAAPPRAAGGEERPQARGGRGVLRAARRSSGGRSLGAKAEFRLTASSVLRTCVCVPPLPRALRHEDTSRPLTAALR